ncbi:hypothetical protein CO050_00135 [Candidatus Roizmanbacteria bacterium CG_4_9_14_0_2_um_filter_38_17]|nr:hypothetical protein [Candidatus Paceibacterota bacterium]PJC32377.1 MAG: hypothetical protein CO050_00135 [Candidatus Roizmanbacteria bacterium CG_4_9_14_0_2_um_filter_38_17]
MNLWEIKKYLFLFFGAMIIAIIGFTFLKGSSNQSSQQNIQNTEVSESSVKVQSVQTNFGKIPSDVTILKTDYDTATDLKAKYNITMQDSFVQVDNEGNEISKWNSGGEGIKILLVVSFTIASLLLATLVRVLGIPADTVRLFAVGLLVFFGLSMVFPSIWEKTQGWIERYWHFQPSQNKNSGFGGGFITGVGLGIVWTPCIGPGQTELCKPGHSTICRNLGLKLQPLLKTALMSIHN